MCVCVFTCPLLQLFALLCGNGHLSGTVFLITYYFCTGNVILNTAVTHAPIHTHSLSLSYTTECYNYISTNPVDIHDIIYYQNNGVFNKQGPLLIYSWPERCFSLWKITSLMTNVCFPNVYRCYMSLNILYSILTSHGSTACIKPYNCGHLPVSHLRKSLSIITLTFSCQWAFPLSHLHLHYCLAYSSVTHLLNMSYPS